MLELTFRLSRHFAIDHPLNQQLLDLGYTPGGFIPPRHGFNRRLGITVWKKLLREAQRLDRIMAPDTPLMVDYEQAFRWARSPEHPSCPPGWTTERSYDLVRDTYNFMREKFAHRFFTDWGRNARWSNEVMDRLGGNLTCCCPDFNRKTQYTHDRWIAIKTQEYEENVRLWRMPIYLSLTNYAFPTGNAPPARPLTDPEWQTTIDFAVEKEPDWICLIGVGSSAQIVAAATKLRDAVAAHPEF